MELRVMVSPEVLAQLPRTKELRVNFDRHEVSAGEFEAVVRLTLWETGVVGDDECVARLRLSPSKNDVFYHTDTPMDGEYRSVGKRDPGIEPPEPTLTREA